MATRIRRTIDANSSFCGLAKLICWAGKRIIAGVTETTTAPQSPDDEQEHALRNARLRFVSGFDSRMRSIAILIEGLDQRGEHGPLAAAQQAARKLAGVGGMLGFPTVSEQALVLESSLSLHPPDLIAARASADAAAKGFAADLATPPPAWAIQRDQDRPIARLFLIQDDAEQQRVAADGLRAAGYRVFTGESGPTSVALARTEQPDLILLDTDRSVDGLLASQELKLDPATSAIPLILVTSRDDLIDRMAGLALSADDYVRKPYTLSELLMRIRLRLAATSLVPAVGAVDPCAGILAYESFAITAREALASEPAALVILLTPTAMLANIADRLTGDLRRRDLLGRYGPNHLILLAPGMSAAAARSTVQAILDSLETLDTRRVAIGAADVEEPIAASEFEALVARAELAMAEDRVARSTSSERPLVLIADEDPDMQQIVDARLQAAGYRTLIAFDGEQALNMAVSQAPAVMLLDLMMPKLTGFDVLGRLRDRGGEGPRIIVVSARERDEDVTRAFDLGADDYVSKPFSPDELVARIARLLK